ncbi:class I SAM-dependent methyltransferase [Salinarimonas soli]|uniref:Methyltransferase domain-containing protein n=1 Tax=Salinarimonas soli TaxID=1638099 RepID=A0A5B2VA14_9HYPH|nr:methyltransferase domain-containing protein [Salinarimonas soli]KAA2235425.1 methyltransferase domain-containing protein [Salinarimonas soli]
MTRTIPAWCLGLALALPLPAPAQEIVPLAPPGAPASAFPRPDRPIAEIVSPIWADEASRDAIDEAGQLARRLAVRPGMTVADIGAGSGYHTVRFSKMVGPEGRILAQDVTPAYLADLARRVRSEKLSNVTLALGEPHDPRLPPGSVDVAILVHMYHEIAQPFAFLHNLVPALKPGARVGIVDLARPTWQHGTPPDLLRCEVEAVGYRQVALGPLQGNLGYLAIFEPPAEGARVDPAAIRPCPVGKP